MPICNITGIHWDALHCAPDTAWPHPALSNKLKPIQGQPYLSMCAALYAMSSTHNLIQFREPMRQQNFTKAGAWLDLVHGLLVELHNHLRGVGTKRMQAYPVLVLSAATTHHCIESWLNECLSMAEEYEQLATPARDKANEHHYKIISAANKQAERLSNSIQEYIERVADAADLLPVAIEQFKSAIRAPYGVSDRSIAQAMNTLHDFAPVETIDDQLHCDTLIQRLSDALLDSTAREAARIQKLNSDLARSAGLFNTTLAPSNTSTAPAHSVANNPKLDALRALLAQRKGS